jgi:hypothetical protein
VGWDKLKILADRRKRERKLKETIAEGKKKKKKQKTAKKRGRN